MVGPTRSAGAGAAPSRPLGPAASLIGRASCAAAAGDSCATRRERIDVNGTRISRKTSIETRKPANRKSDAEELAELEQLGRAEPVERCR